MTGRVKDIEEARGECAEPNAQRPLFPTKRQFRTPRVLHSRPALIRSDHADDL